MSPRLRPLRNRDSDYAGVSGAVRVDKRTKNLTKRLRPGEIAVIDHIDLDSHLNLEPDPAEGAPIVDGVIVPTERPGHGAKLI